jgi:hypothetical protein
MKANHSVGGKTTTKGQGGQSRKSRRSRRIAGAATVSTVPPQPRPGMLLGYVMPGLQMEPAVSIGDYVLFSPEAAPKSGELAGVEFKDGVFVLRKVYFDGEHPKEYRFEILHPESVMGVEPASAVKKIWPVVSLSRAMNGVGLRWVPSAAETAAPALKERESIGWRMQELLDDGVSVRQKAVALLQMVANRLSDNAAYTKFEGDRQVEEGLGWMLQEEASGLVSLFKRLDAFAEGLRAGTAPAAGRGN